MTRENRRVQQAALRRGAAAAGAALRATLAPQRRPLLSHRRAAARGARPAPAACEPPPAARLAVVIIARGLVGVCCCGVVGCLARGGQVISTLPLGRPRAKRPGASCVGADAVEMSLRERAAAAGISALLGGCPARCSDDWPGGRFAAARVVSHASQRGPALRQRAEGGETNCRIQPGVLVALLTDTGSPAVSHARERAEALTLAPQQRTKLCLLVLIEARLGQRERGADSEQRTLALAYTDPTVVRE